MGATLKMKECDTMRILVVEDDRLLNNTLCYNLNTAGYTVDSALTKSAAGSFLTKQDYDLIVLDVNLPDGNGFDFCREVKERRPDTAIIFLTANDMESDMLKGYELGAEDYVTKPFPMSVFQKKLAVVLGRLTKQYGGDTYEDGTLTINFSEMSAIQSRYEKQQEMAGYLLTSRVLATGLSAVFLLIGIMNFINTMVVSVNTRKHEFATLESIGMTKKQIRNVLLWEGGYYWSISFLLLATLGTAIYIPIYSVFRKMVPYAAFSYPVIPLLSVAAIVLLVCFVTPVITFKQGVKESVVERLRQN